MNSAKLESVLLPNVLHGVKSGRVTVPDFCNLRFSNFRHSMLLSLAAIKATLLCRIRSVIFWCSDKQVLGVYACWIVAFVANKITVRNFSILIGICKSASNHIPAIELETSVPPAPFMASPRPAFVFSGNQNPRPKSFSFEFLRIIGSGVSMILHNKFVLLCRAPGCWFNAGAICFPRIAFLKTLSL